MPIGLYIHVPFCKSKCAYCDFYSFPPTDEQVKEEYTRRIIEDLEKWAARVDRAADTLYFGGGTPSLLGGERIARIVMAAKRYFGLEDAEITVECNPGDDLAADFKLMADAGVNRISIGGQSAVNSELKELSRRHSAEDTEKTVYAAINAGITDISVDIMLGIPRQSHRSLNQTVKMFSSLPINHISAYILKVEKGTPMEKRTGELADEDTVADLYLQACRELKDAGFHRYEISNFGKNSKVSRHNVKYWHCEEYLGLGPAAHSFIDGRRFCFGRSFSDYMEGAEPVDDGVGGDLKEYIMLNLRLDEGLNIDNCAQKFGPDFKSGFETEAEKFIKMGLMKRQGSSYSFTDQGALVSNECILRLTKYV